MAPKTVKILLLLASFALASCAGIPSQHAASELNFYILDNILFVTLQVNGKSAGFIIDTGAALSLVDTNQAKRYGITIKELGDHSFVQGIGKKNSLFYTSNTQIQYKQQSLTGLKIWGSDLSHLNALLSHKNTSILGILGSDFLRKNHAIIDYKNHKIILANR